MKLQLSLFILLKFKLQSKLPFGHRIVHNGKIYTHLFFGLFIIKLISLRFQKEFRVSFLNKENQRVHVTVVSKSQMKRYATLPGYELKTKRVWKK